jgi:hypothetical protein
MQFAFMLCACGVFALIHEPGEGAKKIGEPKTLQKEVVEQGVSMVAILPEESVAGSTINLKIKTKNVGNEDLRGFTQGKYWDFDLGLIDSKGQAVPFTRFGKHAFGFLKPNGPGVSYKFAKGDEVNVTLNIARVFDLSQPGEYSLTIGRGYSKYGKTDKGIAVKIEKMTFKVSEESQ